VARLKGITVAGKTGSAQATDRGKKDTIAWFCCFAPFEKPRLRDLRDGGQGGTTEAVSLGR